MTVKDLPDLGGLSEQQVRGKACVWCAVTLENGTAIDLGPRPLRVAGNVTNWFPRGCRSCTTIEVYKLLVEHGAGCKACKTRGGLCSTRDRFVALRRRARG